jgi:hypothetical protein
MLDERRAASGYSHYRDGVVVEYCRDIFGGELVGRIADEKAGLSDGTVTDDNASSRTWSAKALDRIRAARPREHEPG